MHFCFSERKKNYNFDTFDLLLSALSNAFDSTKGIFQIWNQMETVQRNNVEPCLEGNCAFPNYQSCPGRWRVSCPLLSFDKKKTLKGRRKRKSATLTDIPVKKELDIEHNARQKTSKYPVNGTGQNQGKHTGQGKKTKSGIMKP